MKQPFLKKEDIVYLQTLSEDELLDKYLNWLNDKEITQYLEIGYFPVTAEEARKYIKSCNDVNNLLLAIISAKDDKHIGNIRLGPIYWIQRKADIGIIIGDHDYRGNDNHIVKVAIGLILEYAFMRFGLVKVAVDVIEIDTGTIRLYEKLGFRKEAVLRKHAFSNGSFYDVFVYGLLEEDFTNHSRKKTSEVKT